MSFIFYYKNKLSGEMGKGSYQFLYLLTVDTFSFSHLETYYC